MSLVQHVTQIEGTDRDEALVDLFLPPLERHASVERSSERRLSLESGHTFRSGKSIRRIISYDALRGPDNPLDEFGGVTQYHYSTKRRLGTLSRSRSGNIKTHY